MATTIQKIETPKKYRALDTSGNNNHGQIYSGRGLEFDGVTDYLDGGTNTNLIFNNGDHTLVAWFNCSSFNSGKNYILAIGNASAGKQSSIGVDGASGYLFNSAYASPSVTTAATVNVNTWYRLVMVYTGNGTNTADFYLNGVFVEQESIALDVEVGKLTIGTYIGAPSINFVGMISDVQVWDAAWSAADVTYDYLNPESLALNNSGTSLTNSNLKLWYPMQDGHRGQQSYILDGSNTGLGDEMLSQPVDLVSDCTTNSGGVIVDADTFTTAGGTFDGIRKNSFLTAGTSYKLIIEGTTTSSGFTIGETTLSGNEYGSGSGTHYFTAIGTGSIWLRQQTAGTTDITSFSIKPINDKNHATTVFHGDEMWDGTQGDDANWALFGSNTKAEDAGAVKITYVDNASGAYIMLRNANDLNADLVIGRTYIISCSTKVNQGSITWRCLTSGGGVNNTATAITSTSFETRTMTVVADHATDLYIHSHNMTTGDIVWIKDISVKEVGVASGWTDADQQLHIPQTALQSYNELAWFEGSDEHVVIADDNLFSFGDGSDDSVFSVSVWVFMNEAEDFIVIGKGIAGSTHEWLMYTDSNGKLAFYAYDESANAYVGRSYDTALTSYEGSWIHLVGTYDASEANSGFNIYLNGQQIDDTDFSSGSYTAMENLSATVTIGRYYNTYSKGSVTEASIWSTELSQAEVNELYNDGKALDATTHSESSNLVGYWRNNGLSTWTNLDNPGTLDGTPTNFTETILIPAGVDATRDNQGFIMNRQRDTSSLNQTSEPDNTYGVDLGSTSTFAAEEAFSMTFWAKPRDITANRVMGFDGNDYLQFKDTNEFRIKANNVIDDLAINDPSSWTADEWVHISIVRNPGDLVTLYVNGTAQTDPETADEAFDYRYIGGLASNKYRGQLDNFLIYDDELSAAEVLRNYNAGKGSHRNKK